MLLFNSPRKQHKTVMVKRLVSATNLNKLITCDLLIWKKNYRSLILDNKNTLQIFFSWESILVIYWKDIRGKEYRTVSLSIYVYICMYVYVFIFTYVLLQILYIYICIYIYIYTYILNL